MNIAEQALAKHGTTGDQLMRMSYAIAHAYARRTGSGLDSRVDDLAQHLALKACRIAPRYQPHLNPNSTFNSWLWDQLEPACIDWHRRKAEGFGDRRAGQDGRMIPSGDEQTIRAIDNLRFDDDLATQDRIERWQAAAVKADRSFEEWIVMSLDWSANRAA